MRLYRQEKPDTDARDGLAVAMATASDDEVVDEVIELAGDPAHGTSRVLLAVGFRLARRAPARLFEPHAQLPTAGQGAPEGRGAPRPARAAQRPARVRLRARRPVARRPCARRVRRGGQIYGRKITPNLRSGMPLHVYLPGPTAASSTSTLCRRLRK